MSALSLEPAGLDPSRRYIDLARLGRTDWLSGLKGLVRIVAYSIAGLVMGLVGSAFVAIVAAALFSDGHGYLGRYTPAAMIVAYACMTWAMIKGVQHAVTFSQQRPLWSLLGSAHGLSIGRVATGILITLMIEGAVLQASAWVSGDAVRWFDWPFSGLSAFSCLASIALVIFQASSEELVFRGWLTQSIGQVVRSRLALMLIVALLFALLHGFSHGILALPYFMIASLGFSILSLRDSRLELAMGAHIAHNWLATVTPPDGELPGLGAGLQETIVPPDLAASAVVVVLVCGAAELLRRYGWLSPSAA